MMIETSTIVAITGAGGGIGRALATELAKRQCRLALADRDAHGLMATAALCRQAGAVCTAHIVDVSDEPAVMAYADDVVKAHGGIDIVINNAGVALQGDFEEISLKDFRWLMDINLYGVVAGTKAFLPHLTKSKSAAIVNVSSAFGLAAFPGQSAYSASKFAVRGFTEALRHELEITHPNVRAICVYPSGIRTNIAKNARAHAAMSQHEQDRNSAEFDDIATMTAGEAAQDMITAIEGRKTRVLIGPGVKIVDIIQRLWPETYMRSFRRWMEPKPVAVKGRPVQRLPAVAAAQTAS